MIVQIFLSQILLNVTVLDPLQFLLYYNLCLLAEFAAYYYKEYKENSSDETGDAQPEVLTCAIENQHSKTDTDSLLPNKIKLMNTGESMKSRKVKAVIRFHTPNLRKEPELFFHHLLMLYYPWRDEGTK